MQLYGLLCNVFLYLFSISLFVLCIYFFKTKRFLVFFFPAILFLPEYYGLVFTSNFPILTVKRMIYLVLFVYVFVFYRKDIVVRIKSIRFSWANLLLFLYFFLRILSNLYYVTTYSQPLKTIFSIVFEQAFLFVSILLISPSENEYISIIKSIVYCSSIVFILGIFESLSGFRLTDCLYTIQAPSLNEHHYRLGLLRATSTLSLANFYGNACAMLLPLIMCLYEKYRQKRYIIISAMCCLACIHSATRSSCIFLFAIALLGAFIHIPNLKRILLYLRNCFAALLLVLSFIIVFSLISAKYKQFYSGMSKSVLNEIGFNFELGNSDGNSFGKNLDGTYSRVSQFYGIIYTARKNILFGLGSGAQVRADIHYYFNGKWKPAATYDVGYVQCFADEGLLGCIGFFSLLISMFITSYVGKSQNTAFKFYILGLLAYSICILASANMWSFLFTYCCLIIINKSLRVR